MSAQESLQRDRPLCELYCQADEPHLQQIYTGFSMLARRGELRMRQHLHPTPFFDPSKPGHLSDSRASHLLVDCDGVRVAYDVHDAGEIDAELLERADIYFKRSWEQKFIDACAHPERILPLGANVWVHDTPADMHALKRAFVNRGGARVKAAVRALGVDRLLGDRLFTPRLSDIEAAPPIELAPRVLFLAEAWNPAEAPTPETAAERIVINAMRAGCMRLLREQFGAAATCGFRPTPFAQREFADLALTDSSLSRKRNYLALVRAHPICVATIGLHRSTGWKFAEYLSMARAIVSEHVFMRLPGDIASGKNYLEFDSPESCAGHVERLFSDAALRAKMMRANHDYYLHYLRPDALVANSLRAVRTWKSEMQLRAGQE
ncbi:MAG: hypothetical protein ABI451_03935 [Dokdonella sp.]